MSDDCNGEIINYLNDLINSDSSFKKPEPIKNNICYEKILQAMTILNIPLQPLETLNVSYLTNLIDHFNKSNINVHSLNMSRITRLENEINYFNANKDKILREDRRFKNNESKYRDFLRWLQNELEIAKKGTTTHTGGKRKSKRRKSKKTTNKKGKKNRKSTRKSNKKLSKK
jgi:hypothetical protein